jgi:hypothetical protein
MPLATVQVEIVLGANCPRLQLSWVAIVLGGNCPGWQMSWVAIVRVAIVWVAIVPGGNFPAGGNCPRTRTAALEKG